MDAICSGCGAIYFSDDSQCPGCGVELGSTDSPVEEVARPVDEKAQSKFVNLGVVDGLIEENLVAEVFRAEGIPHFIRNRGQDNVGMMLIGQEGWARVFVPEAYEEQARELLDAIKNEDGSTEFFHEQD